MENLSHCIGENLKRLRAEQALSLDGVAKLSGVSKSMLGQIERGEVSPTVSTLWRIANGLKVSFSSLVKRSQDDPEVITRGEVTPLIEDGGKVRNYPIFPFDAERSFEMYRVEIDPGGYLPADGHNTGAHEFITLHTGQLAIRVGEDEHALDSGDSIRFKADVPHSYHNPGGDTALMSMVIYYARST